MRIVIIGAPASGKSTVTDHLTATRPGLGTFGVRRHFARQVELGTPLGRLAEPTVRAGAWIPAAIVVRAVREELESQRLGPAFILEGMPGNREQAELLDDLLDELGLPLQAALYVRTSPAVCRTRAAGREICQRCDGGSHQAVRDATGHCRTCGGPVTRRPTDAADQFADRLVLHARLVADLVGYYHGPRLVEVDGDVSRDALLAACDAGLAAVTAGARR